MNLEVPVPYPTSMLVGMSSFGPLPYEFEDGCVHGCKRLCTCHMSMVERPPANDGVQLADQISCCGLLVSFGHSADFLQERFDILLRGFDRHLAVRLAQVLTQKEHRQHKRLNNRAENSHQPTRLREKKMRRFKSAKHAQRFLSAFGPISGHFQPRRYLMNAQDYRAILQDRFQVWNEITRVKLVG